MIASGVFVLLALAISLGFGLLLYAMIRGEHDARTVTDRETGERMARRDGEDSRE